MFFDTTRRPFNDATVRLAVAWAIDRERIAILHEDRYEALWQYYPSGLPGHEVGTTFCGYSSRKAKALLRRAGYPDGLTTVLTVEEGSASTEFLNILRSSLAAAGVKTRLEILPSERYRRRVAARRGPAMGITRWEAPLPDPSVWVASLCSRKAIGQGTNVSRWWSAPLETQRTAADQIVDPVARLAAYQAVQRTIAAEAPYVPLVSLVQTSACSKHVGGFYLHPIYGLDFAQYWKK